MTNLERAKMLLKTFENTPTSMYPNLENFIEKALDEAELRGEVIGRALQATENLTDRIEDSPWYKAGYSDGWAKAMETKNDDKK